MPSALRGPVFPATLTATLRSQQELLERVYRVFRNVESSAGDDPTGDAEEPLPYVEVPRKAPNADEWLQMRRPMLASAQAGTDKLN
jgi:hypothetical protein